MATEDSSQQGERTRLQEKFSTTLEKKVERKLKAQGERYSLWYGLGMPGLVGLSVMIPTLLCTFLGIWIDRRWQSPYSWTLMLLLVGVGLGCCNGWYWIEREQRR